MQIKLYNNNNTVSWMDGSIEFKCCSSISISFLETAEMTSSTKRFQNDRDTGTEAKALCSTSSITKLAITVTPSLFQKPVNNNSPQTQSMWC